MNINALIYRLNLGEKLILGGTAVAVLSLFMKWVDAGIMAVGGFQQQGYIMLLFLIYPCYMAIKSAKPNRNISIAIVAISIVFMFFFIADKSTNFFGTTINMAGTGMYVMLIALFAVLAGVFLNKR